MGLDRSRGARRCAFRGTGSLGLGVDDAVSDLVESRYVIRSDSLLYDFGKGRVSMRKRVEVESEDVVKGRGGSERYRGMAVR